MKRLFASRKSLAESVQRDAILSGTLKALEAGKGLADLAPVPGLGSAIGLLISILEKAQVQHILLIGCRFCYSQPHPYS